jgi:hypothetical protein
MIDPARWICTLLGTAQLSAEEMGHLEADTTYKL